MMMPLKWGDVRSLPKFSLRINHKRPQLWAIGRGEKFQKVDRMFAMRREDEDGLVGTLKRLIRSEGQDALLGYDKE